MRVGDEFRRWTGASPEGIWCAPGRINLIGEHLDYNGGHVLPFAIKASTRLAVRRVGEPRLRCRSLRYPLEAEVPLDHLAGSDGWVAYPCGAAWALRESGVAIGGADVLVDGDLAPGGGLASSAALLCVSALAFADLAGIPTGSDEARWSLALAAQRAESVAAGAPVGIMDQAASLLARAGSAMLLDTGDLHTDHLPLDLAGQGLRLLAADTGTAHDLVAGDYALRRRECEEAALVLGVSRLAAAPSDLLASDGLSAVLRRRARHVVTEQRRTELAAAALREGRILDLGPLLYASHRSMRDDFENSTDTMDRVVDRAMDAGAEGARMTGGGWGGTAIVLVRTEHQARVEEAIRSELMGPDRPAVDIAAVTPGPAARRLV